MSGSHAVAQPRLAFQSRSVRPGPVASVSGVCLVPRSGCWACLLKIGRCNTGLFRHTLALPKLGPCLPLRLEGSLKSNGCASTTGQTVFWGLGPRCLPPLRARTEPAPPLSPQHNAWARAHPRAAWGPQREMLRSVLSSKTG